jgi:hypothetical protein
MLFSTEITTLTQQSDEGQNRERPNHQMCQNRRNQPEAASQFDNTINEMRVKYCQHAVWGLK